MKQNVANFERAIRAMIGLGVISVVFIGPQSAWRWIGAVPLATAILGWCPPYALLGINNCGLKN